ncbi:MAG: metalloprotease [Thaumarchaeota archaeon]|nr:metalloprotease [Nitrososphaerota archaeon]
MKCEFCGRDEALPFVCNYCGGVFCGDHRLPESHQCKGNLSQRRTITAPPQTTYSQGEYSGFFTTPQPQRSSNVFSVVEIKDILIALAGLAVAFSISLAGGITELGGLLADPVGAFLLFSLSLVTVGSGFVLHELSHKFAAQRYGYWAEFRMWPFGLLLALGTSLIGFIFAAPGATYISGTNITRRENGRISIAGPITNALVALIFFPFLYAGGGWHLLGEIGVRINVFLALFNLLPVMPLDGSKVFSWNKAIWGVIFVSMVATYASLFYYFP